MVAGAAINRPTRTGFKGNLSFFAALSAGYSKHLAVGRHKNRCLLDRTDSSPGRPAGPAGLTALGGMGMSFSMECLLFLNSEDESLPTFEADQ